MYDKTSLRCRQVEYNLRWALVGTTTCCIVCASQYGHTYRMLVLSSGRYLMRLAGITCIHDDDHRRSTTAARLWTITIKIHRTS